MTSPPEARLRQLLADNGLPASEELVPGMIIKSEVDAARHAMKNAIGKDGADIVPEVDTALQELHIGVHTVLTRLVRMLPLPRPPHICTAVVEAIASLIVYKTQMRGRYKGVLESPDLLQTLGKQSMLIWCPEAVGGSIHDSHTGFASDPGRPPSTANVGNVFYGPPPPGSMPSGMQGSPSGSNADNRQQNFGPGLGPHAPFGPPPPGMPEHPAPAPAPTSPREAAPPLHDADEPRDPEPMGVPIANPITKFTC